MIYLFLSIVCASLIFVLFRSFSNYRVDTFLAIVINYSAAAILGFLVSDEPFNLSVLLAESWMLNALILGGSFIGSFYLMAITAQRLGASVASVANKMAVIVPVLFAFGLYNDSITYPKVIGIILALFGLFWATKKEKINQTKRQWLLPLSLFLVSGLLDTFVKHTQQQHFTEGSNTGLFIPTLFATAAIIGWGILLLNSNKIRTLKKATLLGGLILGGVNLLSITFIFKALAHENMESSVVFPINNMGVVLFTSLFSYFIFKERLSKLNLAGLAICLAAIALIAWGI